MESWTGLVKRRSITGIAMACSSLGLAMIAGPRAQAQEGPRRVLPPTLVLILGGERAQCAGAGRWSFATRLMVRSCSRAGWTRSSTSGTSMPTAPDLPGRSGLPSGEGRPGPGQLAMALSPRDDGGPTRESWRSAGFSVIANMGDILLFRYPGPTTQGTGDMSSAQLSAVTAADGSVANDRGIKGVDHRRWRSPPTASIPCRPPATTSRSGSGKSPPGRQVADRRGRRRPRSTRWRSSPTETDGWPEESTESSGSTTSANPILAPWLLRQGAAGRQLGGGSPGGNPDPAPWPSSPDNNRWIVVGTEGGSP